MSRGMEGKLNMAVAVSDVMYKMSNNCTLNSTLGELSKLLDKNHFALVTGKGSLCNFSTNSLKKVFCNKFWTTV